MHPNESVDLMLPELINTLELVERPITLVLDDLHHVGLPEIHADLAMLVRHPASKLRLMMATRVDPAIGIDGCGWPAT